MLGCTGVGERVNQAALDRWTEPQSPDSVAYVFTDVLAGVSGGLDHRIGPDDVLSVTVRDLDRLGERTTLEVQVSRSGVIEIPLAGDVEVAGMTAGEARAAVARGLERYLQSPEVSVVVREFKSARIAVLGAVADPGFVDVPGSHVSLTEALAMAGGLTEASGTRAYVLRARREPGEPYRIDVDLDALERGYLSQNPILCRGDVVRVPVAPPFFVMGYVSRVGEYPLKKPTTVLEAIAMAGGVLVPDASPTLAQIRRRTRNGEEVIPVDLVAVAAGEASDPQVQPFDIIEVPQSTTRWVVLGVVGFVTRIVSFGYNLASLF